MRFARAPSSRSFSRMHWLNVVLSWKRRSAPHAKKPKQKRNSSDPWNLLSAKMRASYERDLIARRELEEAQSAVDAARAQLDFVRAQLAQQEAMLAQLRTVQGLSRLSAPFSGVVSRLLAKAGATVAESTPIVTVADVSTLSLAARIVGLSAGAIRAGLPAEVFNADLPGHTWSGTVVRIDEVKGDATPSFEVEIQISAPTHLARGMTVEAAVLYENQPAALGLPRSSVLSMKGKHFVYQIEGWKGVASRGHAGCRTRKRGRNQNRTRRW